MGRVAGIEDGSLKSKFDGAHVSFSASARASLLDLGGRESPYERARPGLPVRWLSVDMKNHMRTAVLGDARPYPSKRASLMGSFVPRFWICPRPSVAADEIHRVLKPGGCCNSSRRLLSSLLGGRGPDGASCPEGWKTLLAGFSDCRRAMQTAKPLPVFSGSSTSIFAILLQNVPIVRDPLALLTPVLFST